MLLQTFHDADGAERLYSPAGLIDLASRKVGRAADSDGLDVAALEQLCSAFESARAQQTLFGKIYAQGTLLDALGKRLRLADYLARFPAIRSVAIPAPVFIVAPFRTGTTFLHRLLAQDPDNRTPRMWEVAYAPPAEPDLRGDPRYFSEDIRIAAAETALRGLYRGSPALARLHPMGPHLAEECLGLLETSLLSHSFMFYAELPSYLDWLDGRSAAEWRSAYETYALQLRLLHWWRPGRRWVLKSPVHLWNLDILCELFPDAHFVQLHRDPPAAMASFCRLLAAYRTLMWKKADPPEIGRQAASYMRKALERGVAARKQLAASRFIDIGFEEMMGNPLQIARRIYSRIGADSTDRVQADMTSWLSEPHPARLDDRAEHEAFNLRAEAVRADFAHYTAFAR